MDYTFGWFSRSVTYAGKTYFTIKAFGVDDGGKIAFFNRQRCYIQLSGLDGCTATIYNDDYELDYVISAGVTYDVDVTDLVSGLDTGEYIGIRAMASDIQLMVVVSDDTNPLSIAMPLQPTRTSFFLQLPPRKLYTMFDSRVGLSSAEDRMHNLEAVCSKGGFYFDADGNEETAEVVEFDAYNYSGMTGEYELTTSSRPTIFKAIRDTFIVMWVGQVLEIPCGVECRILYWRSRFGNEKKATWLLRNKTNEVADSVAISTGSTTLLTAKKAAQSCEFYLPELCYDDMFYYCDILTSPQVWFYNENGDKQYINVTTNSVTLPNASDMAELSFTAEISRQNNYAI